MDLVPGILPVGTNKKIVELGFNENNEEIEKVLNKDDIPSQPLPIATQPANPYNIADSISIRIPAIDRGGSDLPRVPGVVCRVSHDMYEISTKYGKLNDCLRADDLEKYHGAVDFEYMNTLNLTIQFINRINS